VVVLGDRNDAGPPGFGASTPLDGRTLAGHVFAALADERPDRIVLVTGREGPPGADLPPVAVTGELAGVLTGDEASHTVLVVRGNAPLLTADTLHLLLDRRDGAEVALLSGKPAGPYRDWVERHGAELVAADAADFQVGAYAFAAAAFDGAVGGLVPVSASPGDPLAALVRRLGDAGRRIVAVEPVDWRDALTVDDPVSLAFARREVAERLVRRWMLGGVTVLDPRTTWIGPDVVLEPGVTLLPNVRLTGRTTVGAGCVVGPDVSLDGTAVGADTRIRSATCEQAVIGARSSVGPYAFLRGGTHAGDEVIAGAFVEIKGTRIGAGSRISHFACVIDGVIGERANFAAFTGLANFDGARKQTAVLGDDVTVASGSAIVAPARLGDGACTAAGAIVVRDVPPGALAISRAKQTNVDGWTESRFPGSRAAESARLASGETTKSR
jgi:bifunctional UDP-N-acetylglucosamine pyrophosphorylase/glucosamine-1-phosphate N-acetyltransferase